MTYFVPEKNVTYVYFVHGVTVAITTETVKNTLLAKESGFPEKW